MLINFNYDCGYLNYDCGYVLNMILSATYLIMCVFEFLSAHRRKNCLIFYYRI